MAYKSKFTGQQIDDALTKANNSISITANGETWSSSKPRLNTLKVGDTTYAVGDNVQANVSASNALTLNSISIGDTVYNIPKGSGDGGGTTGSTGLYEHTFKFKDSASTKTYTIKVITSKKERYIDTLECPFTGLTYGINFPATITPSIIPNGFLTVDLPILAYYSFMFSSWSWTSGTFAVSHIHMTGPTTSDCVFNVVLLTVTGATESVQEI